MASASIRGDRPSTRAEDANVSTKKLRRMASIRIQRIDRAAMAVRSAWDDLDDPMVVNAFDEFDAALQKLKNDLATIAEYHELPIGEEVRPS